ncbi:MAG: DUF1080 domain-containing protein, partial [Acidobacteria bacterium]|nr:DUF1080 domain-containing protein [Acidobacteriota bacterium]
QPGVGGTHGGQGGGPADYGLVYGSLFDPADAGAGGGGVAGGSGGGVVRLAVGDEAILDGSILAAGTPSTAASPSGAGGSIRLEATVLRGLGLIDASGAGAIAGLGAGSGGRVALFGGTLDAGLLSRTRAYGGLGDSSALSGAAGTVFVLQGGDTLGELILDNGGVVSDRLTELPAFPPGVLDTVGVDWVADTEASFIHSLSGMEVFFGVDDLDLWPIVAHAHLGVTLSLDVAGHPLTAQAGDAYEGLYRFDRMTVRGGAQGISVAGLDSAEGVTVEPGSAWNPAYRPALTIVEPVSDAVFTEGLPITVTATASSALGVRSVELELNGERTVRATAPYTATFNAPLVAEPTTLPVRATLVDGFGHRFSETIQIQVHPDTSSPPAVSIACPSAGAMLAPGTGLDLRIDASHQDGILRVELLEGSSESVLATATSAPFDLHFDVPPGTPTGTTLTLRVRAVSTAGSTAEALLSVPVLPAAVLTADFTLAAGDPSLDGQSVVVAGGTLTVEGAHTFQNLAILDGGTLTHLASTATQPEKLDLTVAEDLFVSCSGAVDVSGLGYPGGFTYSEGASPIYHQDDFSSNTLSQWQVVDEGNTNGPSNWQWGSGGYIRQTSNIYNSTGYRATHLLWPHGLDLEDYRLGFRLYSSDDDSLGLLFRYQDADHYYMFVWRRQNASQFLLRMEDGVHTVLDSTTTPYSQNTWYSVDIEARGSSLAVWVNGAKVLEAEDSSYPAGTFAFFSAANAGSYFDDV